MSCSTRVYVGRLPGSVRQSDLERFFKGYGKIREITLKEGYGFVVSNKLSAFVNSRRLLFMCCIIE
jgi:RNA recognition motif-containing protein